MVFNPDSVKELENIIDGYDTISFDIWDTLITRYVMKPKDVFELTALRALSMGIVIKDFADKRRNAVFNVSVPNPTLSEIYDALAESCDIEASVRDVLMRLEKEAEKSVVCPRNDMAEIFNYAINSGKRVYLVTDMYLSENTMREILDICNIRGYHDIFVSCEYRQLKNENLFGIYKNEVHGNRYLHIGDNPVSDVESAIRNGIDAVKITRGFDMLSDSPAGACVQFAKSYNERLMAGMFCAKAFNSPFEKNHGKIAINDEATEGWLFVAPVVTRFMMWLRSEISKENYSGVLFSSRDGYMPIRLYKMMQEKDEGLVPAYYLAASRQLCTLAAVKTDEDIAWLSRVKFNGSKKELLSKRFCLEEDEILSPCDNEDTTEYVMRHKDKIYARVKEIRENYLNYINNTGVSDDGKYAFFDFVSSGTCQYFLGKIVPFDITGKYFCRSLIDGDERGLKIDSLYSNDGLKSAHSVLFENYKYLENIMSAPTPSINLIDDKLRPVYDEESRTGEEISLMLNVQTGIEEYFERFLEIADLNECTGGEMPECLLEFMNTKFSHFCCRSLKNIRLRDDWVGEFVNQQIYDTDEEILIENDDWKVFGEHSRMSSSFLCWYEFKENSRAVLTGNGYSAITEMLCNKINQVYVLADSRDEKNRIENRFKKYNNLTVCIGDLSRFKEEEQFDYVIITGSGFSGSQSEQLDKYKMSLESVSRILKKEGILFMAFDNYNGAKYLCGYGRPVEGAKNENGIELLFDKAALENDILNSGFNKIKFYYPFPDYRLAQEIYTQEGKMPDSIKDRVLFYYVNPGMLLQKEKDFFERHDIFKYTNSFLVECTREGMLSDASYIALSTDRGKKHGFATVIKENSVIKKPVHPDGAEGLLDSFNNIQDIAARGVRTVAHRFVDNQMEMPLVKMEKLNDRLYDIVKEDSVKFTAAIDKLRECIVQSSENYEKDGKVYLEKGYIDMIPLNCFYDNGEYVFFDQEFCEADCPIDYIMFRALRYLYLTYPDIENYVTLDEMKERYNLVDEWDYFLKKEDGFIWENRMHEVNHSLYRWIANDAVKEPYETYDNLCKIYLMDGFDVRETNGDKVWCWSLERLGSVRIDNISGRECKLVVRFVLMPPPGIAESDILYESKNEKKTFKAPYTFERILALGKNESEILKFESEGEKVSLDNGDPRTFAFGLFDLEICEI